VLEAGAESLLELLFSEPLDPEPPLSADASFFDDESLDDVSLDDVSLDDVSLLWLSAPPPFFPELLAPEAARESVL
jgi:hypothetical protein